MFYPVNYFSAQTVVALYGFSNDAIISSSSNNIFPVSAPASLGLGPKMCVLWLF